MKENKNEINREFKKNTIKSETSTVFSSEINSEFIFNRILNESLREKDIYKKKINIINPKLKFKTVEEYELDFNDIISFRKKITKREMDDINMIFYHNENNDGMISASIAYNFLKSENPNRIIYLEGLKPKHGKFLKIDNPYPKLM